MKKDLRDLEKSYEIDLDDVAGMIKKQRAKLVLLQFSDGLKPYATSVVDFLEEKTNAEFLIWFGSCFGACDTPVLPKQVEEKIDLLIQFGHNELMPRF